MKHCILCAFRVSVKEKKKKNEKKNLGDSGGIRTHELLLTRGLNLSTTELAQMTIGRLESYIAAGSCVR